MKTVTKSGRRAKVNKRHHVERLEPRLLLAGNLEFRTFDGSSNNESHPQWGTAESPLLRLTTPEYGPGMSGVFPAMAERRDSSGATISPRTVSNLLFDQDEPKLNDRSLTGFVFQWGQFLDHDMDLTDDFAPGGEATLPGEFIPFFVTDPDDELYDPDEPIMIPMLRSRFQLDENGTAQQMNQITSYIDGSNVYGSSEERANALRSGVGGYLLTSDGQVNLADGSGEYLPFNTLEIENASPTTTGTGVSLEPEELFVAGDVRANEQPGLVALHTLFVREHNYQAQQLARRLRLNETQLENEVVDEFLFQMARAVTAAEIQAITYNEFLPALLGPNQLPSYSGYRESVNAGIANIFSGSLYRVGHTMLPNELMLLNNDGSAVIDNPGRAGSVRTGWRGQFSRGLL